MRSIPEGAEGSFALTVAPQHLANQFKDAALPPVLATHCHDHDDGSARAI